MNLAESYERIARPLLFLLDPEAAHHFVLNSLRTVSRFPSALRLLESFRPRARPTQLVGLDFQTPIGLAAGFDKNGVALPALAALGFGFIEIGTVTARAQHGNPKPRIFRYPEQEALINRLGFNNDGADAIASRLRRLKESGRWPRVPVGINIGKSKVTPLEEAADDYRYSFRLLCEFADYIALNVSSPNTPGLRDLQQHEALAQLLGVVQEENHAAKPILLKIAPDLSLVDLDDIVVTCEKNHIAGLIATNTTLNHDAIPAGTDQAGGLSGRPLWERATEFVRAIRARSSLPVIASGGIVDAVSAREKFEAGAQLIQVYTGYIYRGPGLLKEICEGL